MSVFVPGKHQPCHQHSSRRQVMEEKRVKWQATLKNPHAPVRERVQSAILLGLQSTALKLVREHVHREDVPVDDRISFALDFGYTVKRKQGKVIFRHHDGDRYLARV